MFWKIEVEMKPTAKIHGMSRYIFGSVRPWWFYSPVDLIFPFPMDDKADTKTYCFPQAQLRLLKKTTNRDCYPIESKNDRSRLHIYQWSRCMRSILHQTFINWF
mmetsp:Transcript_612/g.660  ORF Transcript_612/g.660 Transcript_612/m.660 type:complete len:104 (+) Transcript_612:203-514(+)